MKFEELRNVQVTGLDTLAGEFEAMLRQWNFSSELTGDVITPLQGSGWRGFAAETAAENIAKIRNEIDAAFEEASGIAQTLRDAHTEITAAKADLEAAIRSATDQKLTVDDDGTVHWPPDDPGGEEGPRLRRGLPPEGHRRRGRDSQSTVPGRRSGRCRSSSSRSGHRH